MRYLILSVITFCYVFEWCKASVCFWNSGCPYNYFATATPYNVVRGDIRDSRIKIKSCEAVSIWGLFRNGKSYPDFEKVKNMKKVTAIRNYLEASYKHGNCSLCAQDVENLRYWSIEDTFFNKSNGLTNEGYQEMLGIGKRLKQAYPKLLENPKDAQYVINVFDGDGALTEDSAKGFVEGIKSGIQYNNSANSFLNIRLCNKKGDSNEVIESLKYHSSSDYLILKDRMQRRTGISYDLTDEDILSLYNLCRYSSSGVDKKLSPWCALFTTKDLQVLEYIEDLYNYYKDSYGTPTNEILGRIPLADLFGNFERAKMGKGKELVAYFTQSSALSMAYTALGLFKDKEHLTGAHNNPERQWRSSKISAFSANLFAVLNRCIIDGEEDHNIVFYINEEPLRSICADGICSWQEFEDKMKSFSNTSTYCNNFKV
ncbi:multiple inositol polyphosphate phosphatase 1-like [Plodia interpunctella]|uniref:multiple inositol polyphosphate phosphatase 1-like n=1 Tax=Plodia interpunctella TaxID=58824 RepID=UPI002368E8A2|nr:multiple inositol polyphosphate phosphatase 1-like [Plodia interpunctella]